mgnify:FL=1|jgi:hypothetical protein
MKSKYLAFSGADLRTNKISRGIGGLFAGATAFSLLNLMMASVLLPRVSAQDVAERKNLLLLLGLEQIVMFLPPIIILSILFARVFYWGDEKISKNMGSIGDLDGLHILKRAGHKESAKPVLAYNGDILGEIIIPGCVTWRELTLLIKKTGLLAKDSTEAKAVTEAYDAYAEAEQDYRGNPSDELGAEAATALSVLNSAVDEWVASFYTEARTRLNDNDLEDIDPSINSKITSVTFKSFRWLLAPAGAWVAAAAYKAVMGMAGQPALYDYTTLMGENPQVTERVSFWFDMGLPMILALLTTIAGVVGYYISAHRESKEARSTLSGQVIYKSQVRAETRAVKLSKAGGSPSGYIISVVDNGKVVDSHLIGLTGTLSYAGALALKRVFTGDLTAYGEVLHEYMRNPSKETANRFADRLNFQLVMF